ncbi:MAG: C40 family peptidase [Chloroflexi bacterium]|nr:C40 family peptidase [Chloroflexota bacterium]
MTRRRTWVAGLAIAASLAYVSTGHAAEPARPARVANTDGAALRLRAAPSADAPIVKRLGPGWRLTVIGGASDDGHWLRVEHGGTTGFVAVGYIAFEEPDAIASASPATGGDTVRAGYVANTEGGALRLRSSPAVDAPIMRRLESGARVSVIGSPVNGGQWLRVTHGDQTGYVSAAFIELDGLGSASTTPAVSEPAAPASRARAGWVANTEGAALRVRSAPHAGGEIIKRLAEGWRVSILDGPVTAADGGAWVRIEHGGTTGWAAAAYVAGTAAGGGEAPPPPPAPTQPARSTPAAAAGSAMVRDATRLRDQPGLAGDIIMMLQAGALVERTGREMTVDGYRWAGVRVFGREGWMVATTLGPVPESPAARRLVGEALAQTGRPYVWGGETPASGFDCSGLVRYVVKQVTGIDVTHVLAYQAQVGSPIERDELEIGDLVFFKNTYKAGLSHVGFYLGDGQFVGANNERVGVSRAPLNSTYWGSRYYSARRLTN